MAFGFAPQWLQCQNSFAKMLLSMYFTANETLLEGAFSYKTDTELSPPCGKAERTALAARKETFLDSLPGKLGLDVIGGEEGQGRSGLIQVGCHDVVLLVGRGWCALNVCRCRASFSTNISFIPASTQVRPCLRHHKPHLVMA